jgi:hypothetical protein
MMIDTQIDEEDQVSVARGEVKGKRLRSSGCGLVGSKEDGDGCRKK